MTANRSKSVRKFRTGVFIVILSYAIGWPINVGMVALAAAIDHVWPLYVASATYAFSWILLGIGILVGGPEAAKHVKEWMKKRIKRKRRVSSRESRANRS